MTQKEKLMRATIMAQRINSVARSIEYDAKDYDERWPLKHVEELKRIAEDYLKLK